MCLILSRLFVEVYMCVDVLCVGVLFPHFTNSIVVNTQTRAKGAFCTWLARELEWLD